MLLVGCKANTTGLPGFIHDPVSCELPELLHQRVPFANTDAPETFAVAQEMVEAQPDAPDAMVHGLGLAVMVGAAQLKEPVCALLVQSTGAPAFTQASYDVPGTIGDAVIDVAEPRLFT